MSYGASIANVTKGYKDDSELRRRIEQMRAQAQGANPAMVTPEAAQPQRQIYDIDDPQSPMYKQRHGGSFVTGLIDSAVSGATLPRDVYEGKVDLGIGQQRHWSEPDPAAERVLDTTGLTMTGGLAGSGKGGTTIASGIQPPKASAQAVQSLDDLYREPPKSIRAYHGSPHDFDRFDLSKIGTGEGAQAYGHGLYFADNESVAKSYRDQLAPRPTVQVGDRDIDTVKGLEVFGNNDADKTVAARLANTARSHASMYGKEAATAEVAAQKVRTDLDLAMNMAVQRNDFDLWQKINDQRTALQRFEEQGLNLKHHGHMYEVEIGADPEHFLDWDKPISQQSENVRRLVGGLGVPDRPHVTGSAAYYDLAGQAVMGGKAAPGKGAEFQAAQALKEAGIPGIKYLDQGSRTAGEGSRNYVTFRDDIVKILRKYGVASMAALPPAVLYDIQQKYGVGPSSDEREVY